MKKKLLTAVAVLATLCGYAQTKGTNALGFGISSQTSKYEARSENGATEINKSKMNNFSLSYGLFIKDNTKLGLDVSYGNQDYQYVANVSGSKSKSYGAGINYQQYYPLVKKLYAFAGGSLGYGYTKTDNANPIYEDRKTDRYSIGVDGGLTWFFSKRFAIESSLLSASASYTVDKQKGNNNNGQSSYENSYTNFNLSSSGAFNNLGFKIYLLF